MTIVTSSETDDATSVRAADLDGDGDTDVLSASKHDDKIVWYENSEELGTFVQRQIITTEADGARSVRAADIDGDGDADVLSASSGSRRDGNDQVAWYENIDGHGTFGDQQVISVQENAQSFHAADLDEDGDLDVLSASNRDGRIGWYENTDGRGTFAPQQAITTQAKGASNVYAADLDGDGDTDVLFASYRDGRIAWYEQRLVADANDDGVFDSSDLVQVLQAGEYEDRGRYNSTYEEGDWNGDGDFTSADLVLAFQAGVYERPAVDREVAAAVDWLFARDQRDTRQRAYVA